jgi:hypothetical protein
MIKNITSKTLESFKSQDIRQIVSKLPTKKNGCLATILLILVAILILPLVVLLSLIKDMSTDDSIPKIPIYLTTLAIIVLIIVFIVIFVSISRRKSDYKMRFKKLATRYNDLENNLNEISKQFFSSNTYVLSKAPGAKYGMYMTEDWIILFFTECFKITSVANFFYEEQTPIHVVNGAKVQHTYINFLLDTGEFLRFDYFSEDKFNEIATLIKQKNPHVFTTHKIILENNKSISYPKDKDRIIELFKESKTRG